MGLEKIISVSGKPGLYKIVSQTSYGLIAESLEDGKRLPVYSHYRISSLADISMYTYSDDAPLAGILWSIHEKSGGKELDLKGNDAQVRKWFETILPEFDKERVYTSDIKKLMKWYNLMLKNNLVEKPEEEGEEEKAEETEAAAEKKATKAKKTTKKDAAEEEETEKKEEKPKAKATKKTATKKAGDDKAKGGSAPKNAGKGAASSKAKGGGKVSTPRKAS